MLFAAIPDTAALALAIVDTVRDPLLVLDHDMRIVAASRAFYQTFQLVDRDLPGNLFYEIEDGQWNIPELRELLETIAEDHVTVEDYEVDRDFPRVGRRIMRLNARKVFYEKGSGTTMLLAFEDVTARRAVEARVQDLLREKDLLLLEIQHRVANSLQIIASILLIKARTVQSEETRLQLEDAHKRVLSVAAVQQHLQVTGRSAPIVVGRYLKRLCETLAQSMIGESRSISLQVDADFDTDTVTVVSHQAVSLGLIVTELVMNSLKHAYPVEQDNAAIVVSYKVAHGEWKLTVSDNGCGRQDLDPNLKKGGLGTSIVNSLARQLDAKVDIASDLHGTVTTITQATFKSTQLEVP
ncbi:MAG: sensor histidine kinase [Xanthobacteraceae bacterium]